MAALALINYDPATAIAGTTKSCAAGLALTAIDTANLRAVFTVPASGKVLVRLGVGVGGGVAYPRIMLGILQGATIIGKQTPMVGFTSSNVTPTAANIMRCEAGFGVSGLTPGASLTWDMAYSVESIVAAAGLRYGGPNDATVDNAYGGAQFEVWEA